MCGGKKQSPVGLTMETAINQTTWKPFKFINYDLLPSNMTIFNNGHTLIVMVEMKVRPKVSGGGLLGEYEFLQMHFHWGETDFKGSEHGIGDKSFPCELHLVHYALDYGTIKEALKYTDGLAVLGICFNVEYNDNPVLHSIISDIAHIQEAGDKTVIKPFPLEYLMPQDVTRFFRYEGSLTTPPCSEVVVWTVFMDPIPISHHQIEQYRTLWDDERLPLVDNFRPQQPLNNREIHMVQT